MRGLLGHTFVIHLAGRRDRLRELTRELVRIGEPLGDEVELFPAIAPADAGGFRTRGARGCFLSHLGVIREARRRRLPQVLILEDDVQFSGDFHDRLNILRPGLDEVRWDLFYGGYRFSRGGVDLAAPAAPGLRSADSTVVFETAHCLAIHSRRYDSIIACLEGMLTRSPGHPDGGPMDVDGAYCWYRQGNPDVVTLLADPELAFQRASPSDISGPRWFDRIPLLATAASAARWVRNRNR